MAEQNTTVKLTLDQAIQTREALRVRLTQVRAECMQWQQEHPGVDLPEDLRTKFGGTETALMKF